MAPTEKNAVCDNCFLELADLRRRLTECETDRLYWRREAEVAKLHLAGERRSNSALKGQVSRLKGAKRG